MRSAMILGLVLATDKTLFSPGVSTGLLLLAVFQSAQTVPYLLSPPLASPSLLLLSCGPTVLLLFARVLHGWGNRAAACNRLCPCASAGGKVQQLLGLSQGACVGLRVL